MAKIKTAIEIHPRTILNLGDCSTRNSYRKIHFLFMESKTGKAQGLKDNRTKQLQELNATLEDCALTTEPSQYLPEFLENIIILKTTDRHQSMQSSWGMLVRGSCLPIRSQL